MGRASAFASSGGCGIAERDAGEDLAHPVGGLGHQRRMGGDADTGARSPASRPAPWRSRAPPRWPAARRRRRPGPGSCGSRRRTCRARRRASTSSGSRASSRPMSAAIAPSRPAPLACIRRPRSRTRRTRVRELQGAGGDEGAVLAHRVAGGEGRVRRVDAASSRPALAQRLEVGDRRGEERRLGVLGAVELLLGAFERETADGLAERGVGMREHGGGGRGRIGEGARPCRRTGTPGRGRRRRSGSSDASVGLSGLSSVIPCTVARESGRSSAAGRTGLVRTCRDPHDPCSLAWISTRTRSPRTHGRPHAAPHATRRKAAPRDRHREGLRGRPVGPGRRGRHPDPERPPDHRARRDGPGAVARAGGRLRVPARRAAPRLHPARGAVRPRGRPARRRSRDLAEAIGRSPSATSRLVDGLVRRRLVERRPRRRIAASGRVWLTQRGQAIAAGRGPGARRPVPVGGAAAARRGTGARRDGRRRAGDPRHQPPRTADPGPATDARRVRRATTGQAPGPGRRGDHARRTPTFRWRSGIVTKAFQAVLPPTPHERCAACRARRSRRRRCEQSPSGEGHRCDISRIRVADTGSATAQDGAWGEMFQPVEHQQRRARPGCAEWGLGKLSSARSCDDGRSDPPTARRRRAARRTRSADPGGAASAAEARAPRRRGRATPSAARRRRRARRPRGSARGSALRLQAQGREAVASGRRADAVCLASVANGTMTGTGTPSGSCSQDRARM